MFESTKVDHSDPAYQYFKEILGEVKKSEKSIIEEYNNSNKNIIRVSEFLSEYIQNQNKKLKIELGLVAASFFILGLALPITIILAGGMYFGTRMPSLSKNKMEFSRYSVKEVLNKNGKIIIEFNN